MRWQVARQVGVTSLMAFCRSFLVFLCTSVGHPWLQSRRGVPAWVWGAHGPQSLRDLRGLVWATRGCSPSGVYLPWCGATSVPWGCPSSVREHLLRARLQPCPQRCRFPRPLHFVSLSFSKHISSSCVSVLGAPPTVCSFEVLTSGVGVSRTLW